MTYLEILAADLETTLMTRPRRTSCIGRPLARTATLKLALVPTTPVQTAWELSFIFDTIHDVKAKNQDKEVLHEQQRLTLSKFEDGARRRRPRKDAQAEWTSCAQEKCTNRTLDAPCS